MRMIARSDAGVTLVELMVVLVLLGLMAGVVGLAWRPDPARQATHEDVIAAARRRALASGAAVRVEVVIGGKTVAIAALPDGRVIADADFIVDPLTGQLRTSRADSTP